MKIAKLDFKKFFRRLAHPEVTRLQQVSAKKGWSRASRNLRRVSTVAFAALALAGSGTSETPTHTRDWSLFQVSFGRISQFPLGDGRTVHLNSDTRVKVNLTKSKTFVVLDQGEALFEGISALPLEVIVNGATFRAGNGARFSVEMQSVSRSNVIVAKGEVAIGRSGGVLADWAQRAMPFASDSNSLFPGDAAHVENGRLSAKKTLIPVTLMHKLAWTDDWLWFSDEKLTEAVEVFNRYNRRHLLLGDAGLKNISLGGRFRPDDPQTFVATLERVFDVTATQASAGGDITLRVRCASKLRRCDTPMVP